MSHLDGGEGFDVKLWIKRAKFSQQLQVPLLLQAWMQTTYHVNFADTQVQSIPNHTDDLVDRIFESMRVPLLRRESAELAGEDADIRIINVAIVDISGVLTVLSRPDDTRHNPEGVQIIGLIKSQG